LVGFKGTGKQGGYSLRDQLQRQGFTDVEPGAVITVPDKKLSFPHNLLNRKVHNRRFAVVMSNDHLCRANDTSLIVIVPMTHNTHIKSETDLFIQKAPENGLETDSLAQLALIQPLVKSEILSKVGTLSDDDYESMLVTFIAMTAR
jgi:mRNA-degrading endonuclease toxin of MazEF toxin-antitoxin module